MTSMNGKELILGYSLALQWPQIGFSEVLRTSNLLQKIKDWKCASTIAMKGTWATAFLSQWWTKGVLPEIGKETLVSLV